MSSDPPVEETGGDWSDDESDDDDWEPIED